MKESFLKKLYLNLYCKRLLENHRKVLSFNCSHCSQKTCFKTFSFFPPSRNQNWFFLCLLQHEARTFQQALGCRP